MTQEHFEKLSPALKYQIVNGLGFQDLRPVQLLAIEAVLAGKNCVILAPTAGGKTEAAFFPILSLMDSQDWRPVSALYVAPIRALLNNQEARIERYAGLIGRRAFKWHGDVTASARRRFLNDPADLLLTTPESLEVMLMSSKVPAAKLFRHLRAVVIDEIHAFVGDDRGGHLSCVLERLSRICGNDVQRIGLSATVGNPEDIMSWVKGSSKREGAVVRPGTASRKPQLQLDYVGSLENAAKLISYLHPGKKRLVFVDSRRRVEALGRELIELGVETHVTHSSLSAGARHDAERAFAEGQNCVIVATSALELGIDIGDLDHVIQIDAPTTVAAFLQRMGRTGRRESTSPNCSFLATSDEALLRAAALLRLHDRGFVEDVPLRTKAAHLLAHQIMALGIQEEGIPVSDWWAWISAATPFARLDRDERDQLVEHMLEQGILQNLGGRLSFGPRGEKLYGFRNFAELYAVFQTPRSFVVIYGTREVGTVDSFFVEGAEPGRLRFTLGARMWLAVDIDWKNGVVRVEPAKEYADTRWQGSAVLLGYDLCQEIKRCHARDPEEPWWSSRAKARLEIIKNEVEFEPTQALELTRDGNNYRLWTFAGGRANNLLAKTLESLLGEKVTGGNFSIGFKERAGESAAAIAQSIETLKNEGRPNEEDAVRFAASCARGRLSKFEPCLPEELLAKYLAEALTDYELARASLAGSLVVSAEDEDR